MSEAPSSRREVRHILLTWNPGPYDLDQWSPEEWQAEMVEPTRRGEVHRNSWSVARRKNDIEPGDRAYLLRQGEHGRGLVAAGVIDSIPWTGQHYDGSDKPMNYVDVTWTDALPLRSMITVDELEVEVPTFQWKTVYSSGREVKGDAGVRLADLWEQKIAESPHGRRQSWWRRLLARLAALFKRR